MPRQLVINLTRFGDLIQTQPALRHLAAGSGQPVDLVCLDNFAPAAGLLDCVGTVYGLPGGRLLSRLAKDWRAALGELHAWAEPLRAAGYARVLNLTPSLTGRVLAHVLAQRLGADAVGLVLDPHGFAADTSPWAAFLQTASAQRGCSPFNVADLFCTVAGVRPSPGSERLAPLPEDTAGSVDALLEGLPAEAAGVVALQLGASEERRRWPIAHFARVAERLWQETRHVCVLVGSPTERPLGRRLAELAAAEGTPLLDRIGSTDLTSLAGLLARVRLLITNDTGTMHLAAGLGTPILAVFLCTAQAWDTGPSRVGSICLEPEMACHPCGFGQPCPRGESCRRTVSPELVAELARGWLDRGVWPDEEMAAARNGTRVWRSERDEQGFMGLVPLAGTPRDDRYHWMRLQRTAYSHFLDGRAIDAAVAAALVEDGRALSDDARVRLTAPLGQAAGLLELLEAQGRLLANTPRDALKTKFLATWRRATAALSAEPRLSVLAGLAVSESQVHGGDLAGFLALAGRYHSLVRTLAAAIG